MLHFLELIQGLARAEPKVVLKDHFGVLDEPLSLIYSFRIENYLRFSSLNNPLNRLEFQHLDQLGFLLNWKLENSLKFLRFLFVKVSLVRVNSMLAHCLLVLNSKLLLVLFLGSLHLLQNSNNCRNLLLLNLILSRLSDVVLFGVNKGLSVFESEGNLVHNGVGIAQQTEQVPLAVYDVLLLHLRSEEDPLFFCLNFVCNHRLGFCFKIGLKVVLELQLLLRVSFGKNGINLLFSRLCPLDHPCLSSIVISWIEKGPEIEPLCLLVELVEFPDGQLGMYQILVLHSTKENLIHPDRQIEALFGLLGHLSKSLPDSLCLHMPIYSVLGIDQHSVVVVGVDQGVHCALVLLELGGVLEASDGHSEGVVKYVVVVPEVIQLGPYH